MKVSKRGRLKNIFKKNMGIPSDIQRYIIFSSLFSIITFGFYKTSLFVVVIFVLAFIIYFNFLYLLHCLITRKIKQFREARERNGKVADD